LPRLCIRVKDPCCHVENRMLQQRFPAIPKTGVPGAT
jgi:hypothetical protein